MGEGFMVLHAKSITKPKCPCKLFSKETVKKKLWQSGHVNKYHPEGKKRETVARVCISQMFLILSSVVAFSSGVGTFTHLCILLRYPEAVAVSSPGSRLPRAVEDNQWLVNVAGESR
jgi:hypothetical protein